MSGTHSELFFSRGTNEDGNVGARIGPQVIDLLRTALGVPKLTAQGLDYAANVAVRSITLCTFHTSASYLPLPYRDTLWVATQRERLRS